MRPFFLVVLLTVVSYCQDPGGLVLYGNMGLGVSAGGYRQANVGTAARLGISVGYGRLLMKFDRTVNNEFTTLIPPEKASSYSFLMGLSLQPWRDRPELIVNGKGGIGKGESVKRGEIINYKPFDNGYALSTEKYPIYVFEVDIELRLKNVGMYVGWFFESFQRTTIKGVTIGGIVGIF